MTSPVVVVVLLLVRLDARRFSNRVLIRFLLVVHVLLVRYVAVVACDVIVQPMLNTYFRITGKLLIRFKVFKLFLLVST